MKRTVFTLAAMLVLLVTSSLVAQSNQPTNEAFSWSAELVSLDENARTATVKAWIVSDQVSADFGPLKAGERIILRWSGYDKSADSIARAMRLTDARSDERFTFPVDFVSFDAARRYVTFKVQIPESSVGSLKSLKPGEWVTATSPHGSSSGTTPVVSIRPYVITPSTTTAG